MIDKKYKKNDFPEISVLKSQVLNIADFTDNENTTGYIDLDKNLPIGAIPIGWKAKILEGFAQGASYAPEDGTTIAFVDGGVAADTITDSANGFIAAGFEDGDTFTVTGSTSNDGSYTIVSVTAGTITLATAQLTASEAGIEGVTFTGVSTAIISVGIAGDLDKYSADTARNVASAGIVGSAVLAADACDGMGTTKTVRVTITEGSDFSEYDTGSMILEMYYIETE